MKKLIALLMSIITVLSVAACGQPQEPAPTMEPQVSQMKAICELAVMECYYHNVAKYKEEDAEGILWFKKDKHFWIEYSGVVRLGIDVSLVSVEISDTVVTITIPNAEVLGCKVDSASLTEDSFIVANNSAAIEAEDEIKAFEEAQANMETNAANNSALLASAQQRAQSLLEEYIKNIGDAVGTEYTVKWLYLDRSGTAE